MDAIKRRLRKFPVPAAMVLRYGAAKRNAIHLNRMPGANCTERTNSTVSCVLVLSVITESVLDTMQQCMPIPDIPAARTGSDTAAGYCLLPDPQSSHYRNHTGKAALLPVLIQHLPRITLPEPSNSAKS